MQLDRTILRRVVAQALEEDIGPGDVTSASVLPEDVAARASIASREAGVVAGMPVAAEVFRQVSTRARFTCLRSDGERVLPSTQLADITGPASALLAGERVALNFLQRLSGIATLTRRCVEAVRDYEVKTLDTRKTTPGLRHLEKYAVHIGGGTNHRMGLYDQVLIKDNHLRMLLPAAGDLAGAVRLSVQRAREKWGDRMTIEVEAESLPMVEAALEAGADVIMLDNMSLEELSAAAETVCGYRQRHGTERPVTEASGRMTLEKLTAVAATGVDTISLGALTHSVPALDIAMEISRES